MVRVEGTETMQFVYDRITSQIQVESNIIPYIAQ